MASYLQVENISKSYGPKVLFDKISFNINEGDKIALIAPNGTGKTSLLKILAGKDSSDRGGEIKYLKDIVTAFLEQETWCNPAHTLLEEVMSHAKGVKGRNANEWDLELNAVQILTELGLGDTSRLVEGLSGGELKRVALASVLVQDADFLVMDEPTNHLDLDAIEYLEEYLSKSRRTLFMVTHDRYFLDRVCNTILELDGGNLYTYKGNYSYYLEKREERLANARAENDKFRNLYRRELVWIHSTPCARTGKAKYRIDAFKDIKERAFDRPQPQRQLRINADSARLGSKIINCRGVGFSFGERDFLKDFSYNLAPGEKIGIVGKNGIGKSTFLNLMTGALQPCEGTIDVGETVRFGYYRQEGIQLKENQTVLETVREIAETAVFADGTRGSVTTFLQQFLFTPDMFNSKVEVLSGGEKRRLYLLTVLMRQPNVLVLDEPTNDLDILTLNVLEDYLKSFKGSVLVVSHDRFFLDKVVDHLFVFMDGGEVKDFVGSYSEYREYIKAMEKQAARERIEKAEKPIAAKPIQEPKPGTKRKLTFKEQRELEMVEKEIEDLTLERKILEEQLSSGKLSIEDLNVKSARIGEIINLLDEKEMRWLELND